MQYRRFGRTELQMPVFSCGGMRYQFKWQDVPPEDVPSDNQSNLEATIRRAIALGITHIETARGYGSSEMQLGQILPTLPRDKTIVQTKVEPTADPKVFLETFEKSLAYLNLDHVDLLGIHGLNNQALYDNTFKSGGCLEIAQQLRAEGKVRFIGFSTHGPTDTIVKAIATDAFDYVNLHWYYIFQNNWPAILEAQKHDMGVFIISPSNKGGLLYEPPQKLVDLCAPFSPMVFNDLFCLSHPEIHTLSIGAACPSDFDEHLKVLDLLEQSDEILPAIVARLEAAAIATLGEDWVKTWRQGLPSSDDTPGNINIPSILWLWNLANAYDMDSYAKMRYNLLGNGGHWFAGKQAIDVDTLNFQDCLAQSPHADKIPTLLKSAHDRFSGEVVKRLSQQD
ncbi:MAG: aldo/keto reductase [Acaryochloridaceae cyanobacterium RU_4_10]|nr:aldo/keto reductase [Acaryochloridaceae cyanobacterium RU_4_10]